MKPGWSEVAPPLFSSPEAVCGAAQLRSLLLNEAEADGARGRMVEAATEECVRAASCGTVLLSGEVVLDMEEPYYAALMLHCREPLGAAVNDLLAAWARMADMPHRERDVFHFPYVQSEGRSDPAAEELTRRRMAEYDRLFSDGGLVGYVGYSAETRRTAA